MRFLSQIRPATSLALAASSSSPNSKLATPSLHTSFSEIVDRYDAFILDQFGVLHDGVSALDGAVELCRHLSEQANKKLIILSNTSAPSDKALAKLPKLGFHRDNFVGAVTSGEESSHYVRATFGNGIVVDAEDGDDDSSSRVRPSRALMFTWDPFKPNNPR